MSVNLQGFPARPVHDNKSDLQEKAWERVELGARLCEFTAKVCEFSNWTIEDVRRTCLYQNEKVKLQRERLTALHNKLNTQRDKMKEEDEGILARLLG